VSLSTYACPKVPRICQPSYSLTFSPLSRADYTFNSGQTILNKENLTQKLITFDSIGVYNFIFNKASSDCNKLCLVMTLIRVRLCFTPDKIRVQLSDSALIIAQVQLHWKLRVITEVRKVVNPLLTVDYTFIYVHNHSISSTRRSYEFSKNVFHSHSFISLHNFLYFAPHSG
jgi:hypothetical protein